MGKHIDKIMSIVLVLLKTVLFLFNSVFWFTGAVLVMVGLWLWFESNRFIEFSQEFSGTLPHVIVGLSCLAVSACSFAFSIIFKKHHALLFTYSGLMVCMFMMEMGAVASVVCYHDTFAQSLHDSLTQNLLTYDPNKSHIDFAQSTLQCCGVSNYTDWVRLSPQRVVPAACCSNPHRCVPANYSDLFHKGCYKAIIEYFQENTMLIVGAVAGTLLLPLLLALLSFSLGYSVTKYKNSIR